MRNSENDFSSKLTRNQKAWKAKLLAIGVEVTRYLTEEIFTAMGQLSRTVKVCFSLPTANQYQSFGPLRFLPHQSHYTSFVLVDTILLHV
jgi:hypothetical protein